ncbi:MAG: DUF883 family protein [Verrucomicrobia bacterium]|nr:MAG: DUF883 family protein [Verrucomicrobiota bacterium]
METYFDNLSPKEGSPRRLMQDIKTLLRDTEALVGQTMGDVADRSMADLKARCERLKEMYQRMEGATTAGARQADRFIRDNPVQATGIAFTVGLLLGLLSRR